MSSGSTRIAMAKNNNMAQGFKSDEKVVMHIEQWVRQLEGHPNLSELDDALQGLKGLNREQLPHFLKTEEDFLKALGPKLSSGSVGSRLLALLLYDNLCKEFGAEHDSPPAKAPKLAPEFQFVGKNSALCQTEACAERHDSAFLLQMAISDWTLNNTFVVHVPEDINRICGDSGSKKKLFFCREFCVQFYQCMMNSFPLAGASASSSVAAMPAAAVPGAIKKITPLLMLLGCPGSGKTLITWAFSLFASLRLKLSVLFVLADFGILYFNIKASKIEVLQSTTDPSLLSIKVTPDLFCTLLKERTIPTVDILFIDGVQQVNVDNWVRACCDSSISTVRVLSSSVGATVGNQTRQDFPFHQLYQPSWTFDEYVAACKVSQIRDLFISNCQTSEPVRQEFTNEFLTAMLYEKYHLAGGCARWMLDTPANIVRDTILDKLEDTSNAQVILDNLCGVRADGIVHGLFQKFWAQAERRQRLLLVSRFAADSFIERFKLNLSGDFMEIAMQLWRTACSLDNRALQGWAFEFRLYALIRISLKEKKDLTFRVKLGDLDEHEKVFKPAQVVVFPDEITSVSLEACDPELTDLDKATGFWLKPQKPNHGCYDFAFCQIIAKSDGTKEVELWSVQATISERHSLKMNYLRKLVSWASSWGVVLRLRHVGFVPSKQFTSFEFDTPDGSITDYTADGLDYQVGVAMCLELV